MTTIWVFFILKNDGNVIDVLCNILRIVQPNSHESRSMRMKWKYFSFQVQNFLRLDWSFPFEKYEHTKTYTKKLHHQSTEPMVVVCDEIRGDLCLHTSTSFPFNLDNYMTKNHRILLISLRKSLFNTNIESSLSSSPKSSERGRQK